LQTRCDSGHSVPALAQGLDVSKRTVARALATLGIVLPPRPERRARQPRCHAEEERIGVRAAAFGFAAAGRSWRIG